MSGYLSGWPEATTPELDEFYHHYHGGSPSARPPHADCEADACPFPPYADPPGPPSLRPQPEPEPEAS